MIEDGKYILDICDSIALGNILLIFWQKINMQENA